MNAVFLGLNKLSFYFVMGFGVCDLGGFLNGDIKREEKFSPDTKDGRPKELSSVFNCCSTFSGLERYC